MLVVAAFLPACGLGAHPLSLILEPTSLGQQPSERQAQQQGTLSLSAPLLPQFLRTTERQLAESGLHGYSMEAPMATPDKAQVEPVEREGGTGKVPRKRPSSALRYRGAEAAAAASAAVAAANTRPGGTATKLPRPTAPITGGPTAPSAAAAFVPSRHHHRSVISETTTAVGAVPSAALPAAAPLAPGPAIAAEAAAGPKEKNLLLADVAAEAPQVPLLDLLNNIEGGKQDSMAAAVARDSLRVYATLQPLLAAAGEHQQQQLQQQLERTTNSRKERLERLHEAQRERAAALTRQQELLAQQRDFLRETQRERQQHAAEARREAAYKFEEQRAQRERQWTERWANLREENKKRLAKHQEQQNLLFQMQLQKQQEEQETEDEAQLQRRRRPVMAPTGWGSRTPNDSQETEVPLQHTQQNDVLTAEQLMLQQQWSQQRQQHQRHSRDIYTAVSTQ